MLTKLSDKMRNDIWDRFWEKVDIGKPDECWGWMGSKLPSGYGKFGLYGNVDYAHRISFLLYDGKITIYKPFVLHVCNNPSCVNPNHLYAGNHQDNMDDKVRAGRQSRMYGTTNPNAKLTNEDINTIRNLYATNRYTTKELSQLYGITRRAIYNIIDGHRWKHLPILNLTPRQLSSRHRLSYDEICNIKQRWSTGEYTQQNLAEYFGVSKSHISNIVNNKIRKYATTA